MNARRSSSHPLIPVACTTQDRCDLPTRIAHIPETHAGLLCNYDTAGRRPEQYILSSIWPASRAVEAVTRTALPYNSLTPRFPSVALLHGPESSQGLYHLQSVGRDILEFTIRVDYTRPRKPLCSAVDLPSSWCHITTSCSVYVEGRVESHSLARRHSILVLHNATTPLTRQEKQTLGLRVILALGLSLMTLPVTYPPYCTVADPYNITPL